jgi:hypothetical protein
MIRNEMRSLTRCLKAFGFVGSVFLGTAVATAQSPDVTPTDFAAGSVYEDYLRALQISGKIPLRPWSIRAFSQREVADVIKSDSSGPWALRSKFSTGPLQVGAPSVASIYNAKYAYGSNDGAVWAGRGLTVAATGGVSGRYGPLSYSVAPIAFWSRNRWFGILNTGKTGPQFYAHGTFGTAVDLPQRFGDDPYYRIDPGQSSIRIDTKPVTLGISTANEWIGPATEYPFLLGNNAPGFPHLFLGTGDPANLWIAKVHARVMWGKLYQSEYSPVTGGERFADGETGTIRLMTSAQIVIVPRGLPGLELGLGRFFHVPNLNGEPSANFWKKPLKEIFLKNEYAAGDSSGLDNQLATAFFRWTFPKSGFEVYGESGHEDQFYDLRELFQNPDHEREYMLGFQKSFSRRGGDLDVVRAEVINYQLPTLARLRVEGAVYLHSPLRQGHTNRGQLLGASPGVGAAAASVVSWTRYSLAGRTAVTFRRIVRDQSGNYLGLIKTFPVQPPPPNPEIINPKGSDVIVAIGVEKMRFGKWLDLGAKVEAMENYNRNFSSNLGNVSLQLFTRIHPFPQRGRTPSADVSARRERRVGEPEALVANVDSAAVVRTSATVLK